MQHIERITDGIVDHRRLTVVVVFLLVLTVGSGVVFLEQESALPAFTIGSEEERALEDIESNFSTAQSNVTVTQIVVEDGNVLDRETLVSTLELQREIRTNESIAGTLVEEEPTVGIANLVARTAIRQQGAGPVEGTPSLSAQIGALERMEQGEIDAILAELLGGDSGGQRALAMLPSEYETGSAEASATMVAVFQTDEIDAAVGQAPPRIIESQATMQAIAAEKFDPSGSDDSAGSAESVGNGDSAEVLVVGNGIISAEMDRANSETFTLLGPLALLFVLVTLSLAYRDVLDVALSLLGVVLVLLWTFGALGWLGIPFNPVLIAIPVLLIGLSIDFGIHVFMRYREESAGGGDVPSSMRAALGGVGVALVWVTVTTVVGFLSNLASPVPFIREIGLIAAIGIVGALVVFGALVPPLKTLVDELLERRGFDRSQSAIGVRGGKVAGLLSGGSRLARNAPVVVLVAVVILTAGTTVAATEVSTSFENDDTLVEDAPAWTDPLPEPFATSEYTAKENLQRVSDRFVHPDSRVEFLVEGEITDPETLRRIDEARREAPQQDVVETLANGEARTTNPLAVVDRVAARNESFNATVAAADTNGDGIPDRSIEAVYDELFAVAPDEASRVLSREGGEYRALRVAVYVDRSATGEATTTGAESIAATLSGDGRSVVATGSPIVREIVQDSLLESLLITLLITLIVIAGLLAAVYRVAYGSATLGLVTLVPVAMTVSWVFATMYALGFSLNLVTTIVASLAIGLGVDYSIHVSERFRTELDRARSVEAAITNTVRGTGAALLGSATTTALGFGILAFALVPILQQFGTIMAVMIVYAFLGAVFVLPSLLVLWARYFGAVEHSSEDQSARQELHAS